MSVLSRSTVGDVRRVYDAAYTGWPHKISYYIIINKPYYSLPMRLDFFVKFK